MIRRGILEIPKQAKSIIVFAHGNGNGRISPRNRLVARILLQRGFAVLLPDLSDCDEDWSDPVPTDDPSYVARVADRLTAVIDWISDNPKTRNLRIGLFGARTGAAAVMIAAARRASIVRAVISRGGRPDLADDLLHQVLAPTLMIVGAKDSAHIDHNRLASSKMGTKPLLEVIQGANHLFSEPGMLERVASISSLWFQRNLAMCG